MKCRGSGASDPAPTGHRNAIQDSQCAVVYVQLTRAVFSALSSGDSHFFLLNGWKVSLAASCRQWSRNSHPPLAGGGADSNTPRPASSSHGGCSTSCGARHKQEAAIGCDVDSTAGCSSCFCWGTVLLLCLKYCTHCTTSRQGALAAGALRADTAPGGNSACRCCSKVLDLLASLISRASKAYTCGSESSGRALLMGFRAQAEGQLSSQPTMEDETSNRARHLSGLTEAALEVLAGGAGAPLAQGLVERWQASPCPEDGGGGCDKGIVR